MLFGFTPTGIETDMVVTRIQEIIECSRDADEARDYLSRLIKAEAEVLNDDFFYHWITAMAYEHGTYEDPDHEIGDLQDALREALSLARQEHLWRQSILAAEKHGWSSGDPEHEAGDLQCGLDSALARLNTEGLQAFGVNHCMDHYVFEIWLDAIGDRVASFESDDQRVDRLRELARD